jgi:hypothetical protein
VCWFIWDGRTLAGLAGFGCVGAPVRRGTNPEREPSSPFAIDGDCGEGGGQFALYRGDGISFLLFCRLAVHPGTAKGTRSARLCFATIIASTQLQSKLVAPNIYQMKLEPEPSVPSSSIHPSIHRPSPLSERQSPFPSRLVSGLYYCSA